MTSVTGVVLEPLDEARLEWARQLHNDPDVLKMLTDPRVVTVEEQQEWFVRLQKSNSSLRWVAEVDGASVGVVRIDQIDRHNKSVCVGLDIHRDHRGKGYARHIYDCVLNYWFIRENFNRVWLMVAAYNYIARHLYISLGFVEEGVQREGLIKDGVKHDYVMMSILKSEYCRNA